MVYSNLTLIPPPPPCSPNWHVVIGKNFGSYAIHETRCFIYFYYNDKACMMYKAG